METILVAGKSNKPYMEGRKTKTWHTDKPRKRDGREREEKTASDKSQSIAKVMLKKMLIQTARILFSARTSGIPSWETQGLLARTIQYFRVRDIFGKKFTSSAEEPLVTYPNQTSSRNVRIRPADWPEKYFSGQLVKRSMRATLLPSYTKWFSSLISMCNQKIPMESFKKKKMQQSQGNRTP